MIEQKVHNNNTEIEILIVDLKSKNKKIQFSAFQQLGRVKQNDRKKALETLVPMLSHGDKVVRYFSLLSILELDAVDSNFKTIIELLDDDYEKVREAATIALGKTSKNTENILLQQLKNGTPEIRFQASSSLVEKKYTKGFKLLMKTLEHDDDPEVRANAAEALGNLKIKKSMELLLKIAHEDKFKSVRFECARSAGNMGDKRAAAHLIPFLKESDLNYACCSLLVNLQNKDVIPDLLKIYRKTFLSKSIKLTIGATLAALGDNIGMDNLIKKTDSWFFETRIIALERLGLTKSKSALAPLFKSLVKKNIETETAVLSIEKLNFKKGIKPLKVYLKNLESDDDFHGEVVEIIKHLEKKGV
jgi:HEAT repeats